ncbi:hypothetical protein [Porticoccus hydrocarbonoclasticus]|uniref:hypothetical protein n=1 Tax=Porticoccus hydrocarbonoclasticus TaxID=1073414 RepID=UPI000565002A|nr:hypothetical protein [Porticoccus hydrocarbonoclasticus]
MKQQLIAPILVGLISLYTAGTLAGDMDRTQDGMQTQSQVQDRIYGSQLMTEEERNEYRKKMGSVKTEQERNQIRHEHHERMKKRAKQQGKTLPDEMPATGGHRGTGVGQGSGKGFGGNKDR